MDTDSHGLKKEPRLIRVHLCSSVFICVCVSPFGEGTKKDLIEVGTGLFGKVVYESDIVATSPTTDVDISYLQPGMYLLQVSSSKSVISQPFIKN